MTPYRDPSPDRIAYNKAVVTLINTPVEQRVGRWVEVCKELFPHSWKQQAAMLPRVVERSKVPR